MDNCGQDWVNKAINMMKNNPKLRPDTETKILIIFDKDDHPKSVITNMMKKAKKMENRVATCKLGISNISFEVWLLAHYEKITPGIKSQSELCYQLSRCLNDQYIKANSGQIETILKDDKVFD